MKRVLLSILTGFALVSVYLGFVALIYVYSDDREIFFESYIAAPLRLPPTVFYYFSPPPAEDYTPEMTTGTALIGFLFCLANILLYSIPVYFLLTLVSGFRKPKPPPEHTPPPPPRSF
jgi:hypothetical protein